jgi:hypothetical protein
MHIGEETIMVTRNQGTSRQERISTPALIRNNREGAPSLEVAVDHLPQGLEMTVFDELLRFTQEWVERERFEGRATIWQWFCPDSVNFMEFGGTVAAEFICMTGLPEACRSFVAEKLRKLLGQAIRYPSDPLTKKNIKLSRCIGYIEDGIVWQPVNACTWVKSKQGQ